MAARNDAELPGLLPRPAMTLFEPLTEQHLPRQTVRGQLAVWAELTLGGHLKTLPTHPVGELIDLAGESGSRLADVVHGRQPHRQTPGILIPAGQRLGHQALHVRRHPVIP